MRYDRHFVDWRGEHYEFERLRTRTRVTSLPPLWAVTRRGEFIGTMPYRPEESTKEFEVRATGWLTELLGPKSWW